MRGAERTGPWFERELGPFGPAVLKPYSMTRYAVDGDALLKFYVGVAPEARRLREAATAGRAALLGISVPAVLATGNGETGSWTVFRAVGGLPCSVGTRTATEEYIGHIVAVGDQLHRPTVDVTPGAGWERQRASPVSSRQFLLDQFSPRCRSLSWWALLGEALQPIDSHPVVHLHGDLKPEHLIVDGERLHVVDWEASACGPAVLDYTDVVFHLVRDLIYEGVSPGLIPVDLVTRLPFSGPVLAWRLLLWLDRRRGQDIDLVTTRDVCRLASEQQAVAAYVSVAETVARLRTAGVPR